MINGTFKYPEIRFFGYLPKRIPEPSETRFSDNSVTYGFNDFMTQCRQSPFVRRTASPQNRIRDDPPACVVTEADGATAKSVWKQKNKSSTIKINGTMSKEIFVAFATQKGGIGKSTVTALAASYLHNVKGYNVAVVDCDDPQHSIHGLREHEMGLIDSSTYFKALACDHFRRIKKNAYTIVKSNAVNALDDAERMIATEDVKPDVVFFDMPGTLRSNGVIKTLSQMDYIFTPLSADRFVVESTLKFVTMFRDRLMTTGQAKTKGLHLFWTMVDGRERNDLYGIYEEVIAEMGFPVLSTRLPDSKKFRRDLSEERKSVFRSTIFPMDTALRQLREQKTGEQHRISMAVSRATAEKDKTIERLQSALKSSRDILNIIADILYKASEVFRRAIDAIIHFATEQHKSLFSPSEAADIKNVMQSYGETAEQQKAVGTWLCDYAEHRQPFDEIKHRHTLNEVGDVAEGRYDWKIERGIGHSLK